MTPKPKMRDGVASGLILQLTLKRGPHGRPQQQREGIMNSLLAQSTLVDADAHLSPDINGMLVTARTLCKYLEGEAHKTVRRAIIVALVVNPTQNAIHATLPQCGTEDAILRAQVVTILRLMPEALEPLIECFLDDDDYHIRLFAARVLAELSEICECGTSSGMHNGARPPGLL